MGFRRWASWLTFTVSISLGSCLIALGQQTRPSEPQQSSPSGLGRAPTAGELQAWDISISPDGKELPRGSGNATQGALVFRQRGCSECHGPTGKEGPALVLVGGKVMPATNYYPIVYWPFAPTIFDYIRRAMPYDRPGRLTSDEVYALVALLLFQNEIIQEGDVMDAKSLPKVQMPHRAEYKAPKLWTPSTPRGLRIHP